jgi:hypothetical protein
VWSCSDLASLPPALRLDNVHVDEQSLRRLADRFSAACRPPLVLRVLAKSKTRTFIRQDNSRCILFTLIVALVLFLVLLL